MPKYEDASNSGAVAGRQYRFRGVLKGLFTSDGLRIGDATEPTAEVDAASGGATTDIRFAAGAGETTAWKWRASDGNSTARLIDDNAGTSAIVLENGAPTNSIYVDTNGNVGLRVAPSADLDVSSGSSNTDVRVAAGASETTAWKWRASDGNSTLRLIDDNASTSVAVLENGAPTNTVYVDSSGHLGLGAAPSTNLHIQENNSNTTPAQEVEQLGSGDAAVQVTIPGRSYAHGVDATDSKWKVCTSATAGAAVLGTNTLFAISSSGVIDSLISNSITNSSGTPYENFASGTKMVFYQAAAPTGWTKDTTNNDAALRVVSGTGGGSGGSRAISSSTVGSHVLTVAQLPSHSHSLTFITSTATAGAGAFLTDIQPTGLPTSRNTATTGSSNAHDHALALKYIDVIVAAKN